MSPSESVPVLPGTLPGLLRRCAPIVLLRDIDWGDGGALEGERGVCYISPWLMGDEPYVTAAFEDDNVNAPLDAVALDLSDPFGPVVAAWWLSRADEWLLRRAIAKHAYDDSLIPGFPKEWPSDEERMDTWIEALFILWQVGHPLTVDQVEALRRVVFAVAGLEEVSHES